MSTTVGKGSDMSKQRSSLVYIDSKGVRHIHQLPLKQGSIEVKDGKIINRTSLDIVDIVEVECALD